MSDNVLILKRCEVYHLFICSMKLWFKWKEATLDFEKSPDRNELNKQNGKDHEDETKHNIENNFQAWRSCVLALPITCNYLLS
jgi:hypothetical protein